MRLCHRDFCLSSLKLRTIVQHLMLKKNKDHREKCSPYLFGTRRLQEVSLVGVVLAIC